MTNREELEPPIELTVDVAPGSWIHCDVRGPSNAPPLVVLPPLGGSGELLDPFRDQLARDFLVVTCEPLGSGDSAPPYGIPSTRALARDVLTAISGMGILRAHLFGISLGGMVAQWMAIEAAERIDRLVLASTAPRGLSGALSITAQKVALARCLLSGEAGVELASTIVSEHVRADPEAASRIEAAVRGHPHGRAELAWLAAAAIAHDARSALARIAAPTLVVTGENDALFPRGSQEELVTSIRGAKHEIVAGAGHDVTLDQPGATAAIVGRFLRASAT